MADRGSVYVHVYIPVEAQEISTFSTRSVASGTVSGSYILNWSKAEGFSNGDVGWVVDPVPIFGKDKYPPVDFKPPNIDNMTVEEINAYISGRLSGLNGYYSQFIVLNGCGTNI